jgi:DNA-binding CsgD family transcriptional regulator
MVGEIHPGSNRLGAETQVNRQPEDRDAVNEGTETQVSTGSVREMILASWRLSLIVVTPALQLRYSNAQGAQLLERGDALRLSNQKLCCADASVTPLLEEKVRDTAAKLGVYPDGLLGLSVPSKADPLRRYLVRLSALSSPKSSKPLVELRVAESEADAVPPVRLVAHTLGLTQTQARVAVELVRGLALAKIGEQLGIQTDTVKDHVKAVYQRLHIDGTRRDGVDARTLLIRKVMALAY